MAVTAFWVVVGMVGVPAVVWAVLAWRDATEIIDDERNRR